MVKKYKNKNIKMTKNSVHNLHKYLENGIHKKLLKSKRNNKKGLVSIGELLTALA